MRKHIPSPGWAKRVGDAGSTMIEVIVSVLLLVLFTTATTVAVSAGTNTSSDNRARVGASALAQRELEYISRE
ncbi:MAG: hypothetical protein LBE08_05280, partial [Bifidobacteriaceae bacterium]|nr:hypothetical protein [Bifidobacteriaceae bacterium]